VLAVLLLSISIGCLVRKVWLYIGKHLTRAVYPSSYVEEIIRRMEKEDVFLASGVPKGAVSLSLASRGCGRIVDALDLSASTQNQRSCDE